MTVRFLIHCIILLSIAILSVTLFRSILVIICPSFSLGPGILYAFGIAVGFKRVFDVFTFSHLAFIGCLVIETTLTSHQTSRRFESESSLLFCRSLKRNGSHPFLRIFSF